MDPITQTALGAVAGQACLGHKLPRAAAIIGAVAGMIPDFDVFIVNSSDPVWGWVWHRHFTHALAFIPLGALLAALPFFWIKSLKEHRKWVYLAALAGYTSHAPLDALTSYGTQLLLPFSNARISWDFLPIVDFFVTPVLLIGFIAAMCLKKAWPAQAAFGVFLAYVGMGAFNHHRAATAQQALIDARGHTAEAYRLMPSPGTLVLWRGVYRHDGKIYADGFRTPYFSETLVKEGDSIQLTTLDEVLTSPTAEDERVFGVFSWFADDYVYAVENGDGSVVVQDGRYSSDISGFSSLWGLRFQDGQAAVRWNGRREAAKDGEEAPGFAGRLWKLITEGDESFVPLAD